jgi:predicted RNase H-like HicB family nuclease
MKKKAIKKTPFVIEFEREEDNRWIAEIPKLPGVMAYGATKEEAKQKLYAIALRTLADKIEQGRTPISVDRLFKYEMARG